MCLSLTVKESYMFVFMSACVCTSVNTYVCLCMRVFMCVFKDIFSYDFDLADLYFIVPNHSHRFSPKEVSLSWHLYLWDG